MTLHIEFWELLIWLAGLLLTFLAFCFAAARILLGQVEKRQTERFEAQELARDAAARHWDQRFTTLERAATAESNEMARLARELLELKAQMPLEYVRREDWVRNQTIIEAKLDKLANKIDRIGAAP